MVTSEDVELKRARTVETLEKSFNPHNQVLEAKPNVNPYNEIVSAKPKIPESQNKKAD